MKGIFNREELLTALQACKSVVKGVTPKPVLKCVRLTLAGENVVTADATNLAVSIAVRLTQVQIEDVGATCVDCKDLLAVVSAAGGETVQMEMEKDSLLIKSDRAKFTLPTLSPKDLPPMPKAEGKPIATVKGADLRHVLAQGGVAVDPGATKWAMNAVLIFAGVGRVTAISTDGRRLARSWVAAEMTNGKGSPQWLVPDEAVSTLRSAVTDEDSVSLSGDDRVARFATERVTVSTVLIEGAFPPYEDVIPKESATTLTCDRGSLLEAIKAAKAVAGDGDGTSGGGAIDFDVVPKRGVSFGTSSFMGQAAVDLPAKVEGPAVNIRLGSDFIADGVRAASAAEIRIGFNSERQPAVLTAGEFTYVVMPRNKS